MLILVFFVATLILFCGHMLVQVLLAIGIGVILIGLKKKWKEDEKRADAQAEADRMQRMWKEEEKAEEDRYTAKNRNNHDDFKVKHITHADAQAEAYRMRHYGYKGSERLKVYYNPDLRGWFVGRGWK
jgi:hypothetical protein